MDRQKLIELLDTNREFIVDDREEIYEQVMVANFLPENSVVLELGGRTGTVSKVINKKLSNKNNHLVIEPNDSFKDHLESLSNNLGFNLYMGVISHKPMWAEIWHHGKIPKLMNNTQEILRSLEWTDDNTVPKKTSKTHEIIKLNNYKTLTDLESEFNLKFDTIIADCEGALPYLFDSNPQLYNQIKFIQCEWDCFNSDDNDSFRQKLLNNGFKSLYTFGVSMFPDWAVERKMCGTTDKIGHEILVR